MGAVQDPSLHYGSEALSVGAMHSSPVHFHSGPHGSPAPCFEFSCSSPRLTLGSKARSHHRRTVSRLGLALIALALGGFAIGTTEFVAMGLLPEIARGVGISIPAGGHVISAYALGVVVGAPILAGYGAKFPRRTLLVVLMAAFADGNLLSALAPSYGLLLGARFLAGLPHGAYLGVAALVAADLARPERRAQAVASVMLGLSVANVVGVPAATWLGQALGWRAAFAAAAALAVLTVVSVWKLVPHRPADPTATLRRELGALKRPQVLLAVATGAIGGGGLFAVYSYISPILTGRTGLPAGAVPIALALWGLGMVTGAIVGGRLMDWKPVPAMFGAFLFMAAVFALFTVTSLNVFTALVSVFALGMTIILATGMQVRLMDVSADAQTLGAALNHSAFNIANALGAWLGAEAVRSRTAVCPRVGAAPHADAHDPRSGKPPCRR